jgi:energy-coupling factor transporter transmembrane protein EcfT
VLLRFSGIRVLKIMRESLFIVLFTGMNAALRLWGGLDGSIDPRTFANGSFVYFIRLFAAFLAGRLFYTSTNPSELRDAATRIARRIPFLRRMDLGMGFSLVLGYIPLIFEEWRDSRQAARSRGMSRRLNLRQQSFFITAFLRRLMLKAVELPQGLTARGWSYSRGLAPLRWRARDTAVLVAAIASTAAALLRIV